MNPTKKEPPHISKNICLNFEYIFFFIYQTQTREQVKIIACRNQHRAQRWYLLYIALEDFFFFIKNQGSPVCSDKLKDSDTCK